MTWRVIFRGIRATFYFAFFATLCTGFAAIGVAALLHGLAFAGLANLLVGLGLGILLQQSYRSMLAIWRRESDTLEL